MPDTLALNERLREECQRLEEENERLAHLAATEETRAVDAEAEVERLKAEAEEQDGDTAAERARKYAARIDAALAQCDEATAGLVRVDYIRKTLQVRSDNIREAK